MRVRDEVRRGDVGPIPETLNCGDQVTLRVSYLGGTKVRGFLTRIGGCGEPLTDWPFMVTTTWAERGAAADENWADSNKWLAKCPVCHYGRDYIVQHGIPKFLLACRDCKLCGRTFEQREGTRTDYCSAACAVAVWSGDRADKCAVCGDPLPRYGYDRARRSDRRTCGPRCRQRLSRANRAGSDWPRATD